MTNDITLDDIKRDVGGTVYNTWDREARDAYDQTMRGAKHGGLNGQTVQRQSRVSFVTGQIRANYAEHQASRLGATSPRNTTALTDVVEA